MMIGYASDDWGFVRRVLAVGEIDITIDRGAGLDCRLIRGSDAAEVIRLRLVKVFVITMEIADVLACAGDVECRLTRRSGALEMR
jgi:hypothetical protein